MANIDENLEDVSSEDLKVMSDSATIYAKLDDRDVCNPNEATTSSKKMEYAACDSTARSNRKPISDFFSIPPSIIYEKTDDGDTTEFFDISASLIKDFLLAQVLGMRIFVFILQLLFNSWDFSTDAFKGVPIDEGELSMLDHIIQRVLAGFKRWDAVHILHVAQYDYVFESSLAFFPFYPMTIRVLSMAWAAPFVHLGFIHVSSALLISAVAINLGCFIIAAAILYRIVQLISKSVKQSIIAVLLFSVNPASIFFSAAYTESLYCALTFFGLLLLLEKRPSFFVRYIGSLLCFGLAYATRSNGLLNLGYVEFFCVVEFLLSVDPENPRQRRVVFGSPISTVIFRTLILALHMLFAPLSISLPIFIHGRRQQIAFCSQSSTNNVPITLQRFAAEHRLITVGHTDSINWCNVSSSIIPPFYTAVQAKYWQVSLLGYWQLRKIPCFLMAGPAFFIVLFGVYQTWHRFWLKKSVLHLLAEGGDHVPYALHAIFLALGALFMYNAEVLTRLLFSSSPFPYLVLARWISDSTPQVRLSDLFVPQPFPFFTYFCRRGLPEFLLYLYLMSFLIFGTTMHAMWLPFT